MTDKQREPWTRCPECDCGPGEDHRKSCSFWTSRSKFYKDQWKPRVSCSGCAGITHHHTCGDPAKQPQTS